MSVQYSVVCLCHSTFYEQNNGPKCCFQPGTPGNDACAIRFETADFYDTSVIKTSEDVIVLVPRCGTQARFNR